MILCSFLFAMLVLFFTAFILSPAHTHRHAHTHTHTHIHASTDSYSKYLRCVVVLSCFFLLCRCAAFAPESMQQHFAIARRNDRKCPEKQAKWPEWLKWLTKPSNRLVMATQKHNKSCSIAARLQLCPNINVNVSINDDGDGVNSKATSTDSRGTDTRGASGRAKGGKKGKR